MAAAAAPLPATSPSIRLAQLEGGKGLGVVATRAVRQGETLLQPERPLVRLTPEIGKPIEHFFGEAREQALALLATLSRTAGPPLAWTWWHKDLDAVVNTNSLTQEGPDGGVHSYVFLHISRFNHSCDANACMAFDGKSETAVVRSLRDIPPKHEVTINYIRTESNGPLSERRELLRTRFGFECHCDRCQKEEAAAAAQRRRR